MFNLRWLGRILLCLLSGLVLGSALVGWGPPLPKSAESLGLDAFHKHYYGRVWRESQMPEDLDPYRVEAPLQGSDDFLEETLPELSSSQRFKMWRWRLRIRMESQARTWTRRAHQIYEKWSQPSEKK